MQSNDIVNKSNLTTRVVQLQARKLEIEQQINYSVRDLVDGISPHNVIRNFVGDVLSDKEIHHNLVSFGLHMGANFITDQVLGKNKSIKGYMSAILVRHITASLINNNMPAILSGVSHLLNTVLDDDDVEIEKESAKNNPTFT